MDHEVTVFSTEALPDGPAADRLAPLVAAALTLVGDGATDGTLTERFRDLGLEPVPGLVNRLLLELERLGLVRVAFGQGEAAFRVRTTLGETAHARSFAGGDVRASLADLEILRSDLLSTISHELRTPLTAIRTSIGLLLAPDSEPTDEQRQMLLETVARNADRMQRLIADVLDIARFRQGRIVLQRRTFDAAGLAADAAAALGALVARAGQTMVLRAPTSPVPVYGDRPRLEQALLNLLSNAQKFSPPGAEIRLATTTDGNTVRWAVEDRGPGIPAADRARLFERFFVGRTDRGEGRGGTGLGLPIARAIAQAHGGEIEVASEVGAGSTFVLTVPALASEDEEP
jgi:signal transduction histidine kinase